MKWKTKKRRRRKFTLVKTRLIEFGLVLYVSRCLLFKRKRRWNESVSHLRRCCDTRGCQTLCHCSSRSILRIQKETHSDPNSRRQYGDLQPQWSSSWKAHPLIFAPLDLPVSLLFPFLFLDPFSLLSIIPPFRSYFLRYSQRVSMRVTSATFFLPTLVATLLYSRLYKRDKTKKQIDPTLHRRSFDGESKKKITSEERDWYISFSSSFFSSSVFFFFSFSSFSP